MSSFRDAALSAKAWPFQEARRLAKRYEKSPPEKGYVLFETGYGPSGLPHIGTYGEVSRTTMVRRAFEVIADIPTRLICFSDDMDGMRKVPGNVPAQNTLQEDLNLPLSRVRDPFGTHESFAAHNNARLQAFLDESGFEYDFVSSTDYYTGGKFDDALLTLLERFDDVMAVMLPTLGAERQASYSPFLPVSAKTGHVLQVATLERNVSKGTIVYEEPDGERVETPVTGGHVKLQWKPDWGMRWAALAVDYEMFGKDLIPSADLSSKICRILGTRPPELLNYELFLDDQGQKISKSKGNGLSMEEWLAYASSESLQYFMFQKPKTAKRLFFDVIPKAVDEYAQQLSAYPGQDIAAQVNNPAFHLHGQTPPAANMPVSYSMLLNLASAAGAEDTDVMWGFIRKYAPDAAPDTHPELDAAASRAVRYYNDVVKPTKTYRRADDREAAAITDLANRLEAWDGDVSDEDLQSLVFEIGKAHEFEPLRDWFRALYEVCLGASQGPRFGGFIALFGVPETAALIRRALAGDLSQGDLG